MNQNITTANPEESSSSPATTPDDGPKETALQKQMREGWNQDDESDMDMLANEAEKKTRNRDQSMLIDMAIQNKMK